MPDATTPAPAQRALLLGTLGAALLWAAAAPAATLELAGPPGAVVSVNGLELGSLPLDGPLTLAPGTYVVEGELRGHLPYAGTVRLDDDADHARLLLRFDRLSRRTAWTSSVLYAGLGQFYLDKPLRGWVYAVAETGGLLTALAGELQRSNLRKDYVVLKDAYDTTINAGEAARLREAARDKYAEMEDAEAVRNAGLVVAAAAIGVSVLDALLTFPHVDAGPGPVPPTAGRGPLPAGGGGFGALGVHAAVTLNF